MKQLLANVEHLCVNVDHLLLHVEQVLVHMEQVLVVDSLLVNVYTGIFNLKEFKILALTHERLFLFF